MKNSAVVAFGTVSICLGNQQRLRWTSDEPSLHWWWKNGRKWRETILGHPALWQENSDSRHFWSSCVWAGVTVQVVGLIVVHEFKGGGKKKKLVIWLWKSPASADINLSTLPLLFLHQPHTASTPVLPPCQTAALTTLTTLIITATNKRATKHDRHILHSTLLLLFVYF